MFSARVSLVFVPSLVLYSADCYCGVAGDCRLAGLALYSHRADDLAAVWALSLILLTLPDAVTLSPILTGARNLSFSLPFSAHVSRKAIDIISEIAAATIIPCAMIPPKREAAANSSSR